MSSVAIRLAAMMFLQFFVWGSWYVTAGNFLTARGMDKFIGILYSVMPAAAIISPFFVGMVADRFFATERMLAVLHLVGALLLLAAPSVVEQGAWPFLGLFLAYALCYAPTLALSNSLAFHNIVNQEKEFPRIRVLGTIGWIVGGIVVSTLLKGDKSAIQFYVAGGASLVLALYCLSLPHTPPPAAGQKTTARDVLGLDALSLMKAPSFAIFIISSALISIPLAAYYAFAPVFAAASGFSEDTATWMSIGQFSEIFFMILMPFFFLRLGIKWMLVVGMLAWVIRYGAFGLAAPPADIPWLIILGIALHGICYDFFFVTGQIYVDKKANRQIRSAAQGFLVLMTQGLGMLAGSQISQRLYNANKVGDDVNWQPFWYIACAAAAVIMVIFTLLFRDDTKDVTEQDVARGEMEIVSA